MPDHPVPSERARELVRGGYDPHIHVAPDFTRAPDHRRRSSRAAAWSWGSRASG